jgi:hypothetical protein
MPINTFTDIAGCVTVIDSTFGAFADAGVTPATVTGDIVQQINDRSGGGRHWTNTGAAGVRPKILNPDPHLGVQVLDFDATAPAQFLNVPNFLAALAAATVFWVLRPKAWPAPSAQKAGFHGFNASTEYSLFPHTDGNVYDNWGSTNHRATLTGQRQTATWHKHYMQSNNAGLHAGGTDGQRDGGKITTSAYGFDAAPTFGKGRDGFGFDGFFRLCVIYNSILTDAQFQDVNDLIDTAYFPPAIYFAPVYQDRLPVYDGLAIAGSGGTSGYPILT